MHLLVKLYIVEIHGTGIKKINFQVLLPNDGGQPPKHAGGNMICVYAFYVQVVGFSANKNNMMHGINNIKQSFTVHPIFEH